EGTAVPAVARRPGRVRGPAGGGAARRARCADHPASAARRARATDRGRGRRGALIHHDAINHVLRGRRGARLTALTSGGAIPDTADYKVMLEPESLTVGTVNEDFAVESNAGDIFQLGNAS